MFRKNAIMYFLTKHYSRLYVSKDFVHQYQLKVVLRDSREYDTRYLVNLPNRNLVVVEGKLEVVRQ